MAAATSSSRHAMDAQGALVTTISFGVGRGFAVLVAVFTLMFALMVLGGHLWARRQRKDKHL